MRKQELEIIRWTEAETPQETIIRSRMQEEGLSPYIWSNGPGYQYTVHSHNYHKILYCIHGSVRFLLPDYAGEAGIIDLFPGDCMKLPAGVRHGAIVGPHGVTCLEAPRY